MVYSLSDIAENPEILHFEFGDSVFLFRPLQSADMEPLAEFLGNLSLQTRTYYDLKSYNLEMAREMCDAINLYDKLRIVIVEQQTCKCICLIEYSLDIPENDKTRFRNYGIELDSKTDCRWGLCIADVYQAKGLGTALFSYCEITARQLGKKRIVLWGGVRADNARAIAFYRKCGFRQLGDFRDQHNTKHLDMLIEIDDN